MYLLVAFDLDGTIINSEPMNLKTLQSCLSKHYDISTTLDEIKTLTGKTAKEIFAHYGIDDYTTGEKIWIEEFNSSIEKVNIFEGYQGVFDKLKDLGVKLAIVTSRNREDLDNLLDVFKLADYFDYTISRSDTEKPKPSPEPLQKLIDLSGLSHKEILFIGDSSADMICAKEADVKFGLALWGADHKLKDGCKIVINSPNDIYSTVIGKRVCGCNKIYFDALLEDAKAGKFTTYDELVEYVSDRTDCFDCFPSAWKLLKLHINNI